MKLAHLEVAIDDVTDEQLQGCEFRELLGFRVEGADILKEIEHRNGGISKLSPEDGKRFDRIVQRVEDIDRMLDMKEVRNNGRKVSPTPAPARGPFDRNRNRNHDQRDAEPQGILFRTERGREVRALTPDMPFDSTVEQRHDMNRYRFGSAGADDDAPLSVGRALVGMITGRWEGAEAEQRAMQTGNTSAGGYLLAPSLSSRVIDLARNQSVVLSAGALTLPMDSAEMRIAKVLSDPTANWRQEGAKIIASQPSFGLISLKAHVLAALVPVTLEMLEDAANAPGLLENALRQALGLELDRAALRGSGANAEPMGLRFAPGVNETGSVGSPDYDDVIDTIVDIKSANGNPNAWAMSPRDEGTFSKLKDLQGQYLTPPPAVSQLKRVISNQIPDTLNGGAESEMFIGDFSQMLIGVRRDVKIELLDQGIIMNEAGAVTDNAVTELKCFVRAYLRADVALIRPNHFARLLGVTA